MQVGDGQVFIILVLTVHVHDLTDDAHGAAHVFCHLRRTLHGDTDDDLGPHLAGDVSRIVILQTSIYEHFVADSDR